VDPPRGQLDEEQDVQRLQEHRLDREEVAGQHSPALSSQELAPGRTRPTRRRSHARSAQDASHGARTDPDPKLAELALDPHASPPGVLPTQTQDQISSFAIEGRSTWGSTRVGPLPPHELAVPAKKRLRRDHERGPTVPGEGPARRGEEPPVAVLELGAPNGAAEHPHLVAEHGVLELELRHAPTSGEPSDEANKDEVGEGSQGARDATDRRQSQVFEFWSPTSIGLLGEPVGVGSPTVGAFGVEDGAVADNSSGMTGASSSLRTPLR
jgi:hypothetical protein